MKSTPKKERADSQLSALAGEFFVAGELLKRGFQVSVTFGNARSIDLLVKHAKSIRAVGVQVKSLRRPNYYFISQRSIREELIYVFVLLNPAGSQVRYFVVPGADLASDPSRFGKYFGIQKNEGIHSNVLERLGYENAWGAFDG